MDVIKFIGYFLLVPGTPLMLRTSGSFPRDKSLKCNSTIL